MFFPSEGEGIPDVIEPVREPSTPRYWRQRDQPTNLLATRWREYLRTLYTKARAIRSVWG